MPFIPDGQNSTPGFKPDKQGFTPDNPIVGAIADPEKGKAASKSLIDGIGDSLSKMSGFFESFMNPASKVLGSIAQAPGRALISAGLDPAAGVVGAVKGKDVRAEYQPSGNIQKALLGSEPIVGMGQKAMDRTKNAMEQGANPTQAIGSSALLGAGEEVLGLVPPIGFSAGKNIIGKAVEELKVPEEKALGKLAEFVSERLTPSAKTEAFKAGKLSESTFFKGEKFIPNATDVERAGVAKEIGIKEGSFASNITKSKDAIKTEAEALKSTLKKSGVLWNRSQIIAELRKASDSDVLKLSLKNKDEKELYQDTIDIFDKILTEKKGGTLDTLLQARQELDDLANRADPNIWAKKDSGLYHAIKNARDTINNFIDSKIPDGAVKASLRKQSLTYDILENLSEKAGQGSTKLSPSELSKIIKKSWVPLGASALGAMGIKSWIK